MRQSELLLVGGIATGRCTSLPGETLSRLRRPTSGGLSMAPRAVFNCGHQAWSEGEQAFRKCSFHQFAVLKFKVIDFRNELLQKNGDILLIHPL